jgi:hypothetical protein
MDTSGRKTTNNEVSNQFGSNIKLCTRRNELAEKRKIKQRGFLPDNTTLQASYKTKRPFEQLTSKAREADILPGLKTPLVSVNKMAKEGYTKVFHPGEKGVTTHKPGTISITTTELPILQGCKLKGAKLWTISAEETKKE